MRGQNPKPNEKIHHKCPCTLLCLWKCGCTVALDATSLVTGVVPTLNKMPLDTALLAVVVSSSIFAMMPFALPEARAAVGVGNTYDVYVGL
jgi:hypothetical protein